MCLAVLVAHLYLVFYHVEVLVAFLLLDAYTGDFVAVDFCRTVENRQLGGVHLYEAVVDTGGVEGSQGVFDCRNANVAAEQHCAAVGL